MDDDLDLRATLEAAVDQAEETNANPEGTPEPAVPAAESAAPETGESVAAEEQDPAAPVPPKLEPVKPGEAKLEPKAPEGEAKPPVAPAPVAPGLEKPPGTWNPAAREKWSKLDPDVRSEIWKREKEASRAMTISTEARKFQNEFSQAVQPFLGFIAAEQSTPIQAMTNMMQTAAALRVGTPQQKVQIAADIIKNFGIDLAALDSVLAGAQPEYNPQVALQQLVRQELSPVMQMIQQQKAQGQQAEQAIEQEAQTELEQFAAANEFYWDLKDVMMDVMEVSQRRGNPMGLTEAYERAIMLHEPVRRVVEARKQREEALKRTGTARQARQASLSVAPSSEMAVTQQASGDSVRDAIEAAITAQQGR